jgi:iron(III) transport system ATP-binding protein
MLALSDIDHHYGDVPVLRQVSLRLVKGRIGCVLGPSGSGKTTLLRCIAGFEKIRSGEVRFGAIVQSSESLHVPAHERRVGMVFQDYALLPHLNARQNVEFALHALSTRDARRRAGDFLDRVGLGKFADRFPHELSGGQQQRVAIARALAPEPGLLLMDEPFSNLDIGMRQDLGQDVRELLQQLGTTALVAMHDHHDAFALADDAGVLHQGELLQWTSTYDLYHRPENRFVANFVGKGVWLPGRVCGDSGVDTELGKISGRLERKFAPGMAVDVLLRPDDVIHDDDSALQAQVINKQFKGSEFLYELRTSGGTRLLSSVPSHHNHAVGENIGIRVQTDHMVIFSRES